jgi:flagellar protein FliO/FliZ
MDAIFGMEFPLVLKFVISFAVVLVLIGTAAFVIRRFGAKGLARVTLRGRQPRLAVVDSAAIDSRRRLVIVRRDNVEHLLLIGGPTDLLVEPNIAAVAIQPARESTSLRPVPPSPEIAAVNRAPAPWPSAPPEPSPRLEPTRIEPTPKIEPRVEARPEPILRPEPVLMPEQLIEPAVRIQQVPAFPSALDNPLPGPVPVAPPRPVEVAPTPPPAHDLDSARDRMNGAAHPHTPPGASPRQATVAQDRPDPTLNDEQNLADMAQRLEAALRRPIASGQSRAAPPVEAMRPVSLQPRQVPEPLRPPTEPTIAPSPTMAPSPTAGVTVTVPNAAQQQARTDAATYESLQREMASLLGRKPGST